MAYRARKSNQSERDNQSKETRWRTLTEEDTNRVVQGRTFSLVSEINRALQFEPESHPRRSENYDAARQIFVVGSSQGPWELLMRAMTGLSSSIEDLRSSWHVLCDLDCARAVQSMRQAGMSLRELASNLNCSASLLSYLLRAASAPAEDRELARSGEISTRELVRRAGSPESRAISTAREALAFASERAAVQASRAITNWLDAQELTGGDREKVIEQARLLNVHVDEIALGPLEAYLLDIPLDEVIRIFRPSGQELERAHSVARFTEWLARWSLHGIPNDVVRARALELARRGVTKGSR